MQDAAREAFASIYTALMLLEWMKGQAAGVQSSVWSRGPYGDGSLALQMLGGFSADRLTQVTTAVDRMVRGLTSERRSLRVSVGSPGYDADSGTLTVRNADAGSIVEALADFAAGRDGPMLASYIRNRWVAGGGCLVDVL
jgi:hypothetical protein